MARVVLTAVFIVLLNVLAGCAGINTGRAQLVPEPTNDLCGAEAVKTITAAEADIIEQVSISRQAYRKGLESLVEYYTRNGNNMKLAWSKDELAGLEKIPQYKYIIEAIVAGPRLKASVSITEANYMYHDALGLEKKAGRLIVIKDKNLLRLALEQYNQLIKKHPSSDKIDDAAYRAAGIYEYFKDYSIALLYYQRAYQWDPATIHPAMFKAARLLDERLHRRAEALELYQKAVQNPRLKTNYKKLAENRIEELTKTDQGSK